MALHLLPFSQFLHLDPHIPKWICVSPQADNMFFGQATSSLTAGAPFATFYNGPKLSAEDVEGGGVETTDAASVFE